MIMWEIALSCQIILEFVTMHIFGNCLAFLDCQMVEVGDLIGKVVGTNG